MSDPYDFATLLDSQVLYRVTDSTSISPLFWTGRRESSGFSSPNLNLAYLSPESYNVIYTKAAIDGDTGTGNEQPYLRHTVLDHVMGKEKQTCLPTLTSLDERPDTPEDEKTPWISTSADLVWVVYEICRRLILLQRGTVGVTLIDIDTKGKARPLVMIDPSVVLRINHSKAKDLMLSVGMKENYDLARQASETSSERLIWGRVIADSILKHFEFTLEYSPFQLTDYFYRSAEASSAKRWTEGLVWNPRVDAYDIAKTKIRQRQRELGRDRLNGTGRDV